MFFILPERDVSTENKKRTSAFPLWSWLFVIYMVMLFYVTLFAWNYGASLGPVGPGGRNYNLTPFLSIYRIAVFSPDLAAPVRILAGNVILFMPFGFLFPLFVKQLRRRKKEVSIFTVIFTAMLLSVSIEIAQFVFTYRVSNIDDVILNTFGALIGVCVYRTVRRIKFIRIF